MDPKFVPELRYATTADENGSLSTKDVVLKYANSFSRVSHAIARDALDVIASERGLQGSPPVSRVRATIYANSNTSSIQKPGNLTKPLKDYPMRFKTTKEMMESSTIMALTAMDIEEFAIHEAVQLPKDVTEHFLPCINKATIGLIGDTAMLLVKTQKYGSRVREPLNLFYCSSMGLFLMSDIFFLQGGYYLPTTMQMVIE